MAWRHSRHLFSATDNQCKFPLTVRDNISIAVRAFGSLHRDFGYNRIDVNRNAHSLSTHQNTIVSSVSRIWRRNFSKVPKGVIDTIKSKVEEMEAPTQQNDDERNTRSSSKVKKTQDDFAEYLTSDKPSLDNFIERRQGKSDNSKSSSQVEDTSSSSATIMARISSAILNASCITVPTAPETAVETLPNNVSIVSSVSAPLVSVSVCSVNLMKCMQA